MLIINKTKFAKNSNELIDTLFSKGGTANGTYRRYKRKIHFYNGAGVLFAALIRNKDKTPFFVSASMVNGKARYSYGLCSNDKILLGLANLSIADEMRIASQL